MAKKAAQENAITVTAERSKRLFQLLKLLSGGPQTRAALLRRLRLALRGFYRDLEVLRCVGILVHLSKGKYSLEEDADKAIARLPFPDPLLSLGEARQLARGRSAAHGKLRELLEQIER
jgi:predicted DNA-binding transcriptional regulator YafY